MTRAHQVLSGAGPYDAVTGQAVEAHDVFDKLEALGVDLTDVFLVRELRILPSTHGVESGVKGSAAMILDDVLSRAQSTRRSDGVDFALSQPERES